MGTRSGTVQMANASMGMAHWQRQGSFIGAVKTVAMSPDGRFVGRVGEFEKNWTLWDAAGGGVCMTGARHHGLGACTSTDIAGDFESLDGACPVQAHTLSLALALRWPSRRADNGLPQGERAEM